MTEIKEKKEKDLTMPQVFQKVREIFPDGYIKISRHYQEFSTKTGLGPSYSFYIYHESMSNGGINSKISFRGCLQDVIGWKNEQA